MVMAISSVNLANMEKDIFKEGNLVISGAGEVYLVTAIAQGYGNNEKGTFWAIPLTTGVSEGNWLKSDFKQFVGTITLEGKY